MTNKEAMEKMVNQYGIDAIMEMAKAAEAEIRKKEAKYTTIISPYEYSGAGRVKGIEFPDWVNETFDTIVSEMGVAVYKRGSGDTRNMAITMDRFAKYIVYTCNDDGETLRNVIDILRSAPAWCKGRGMTRARMELVFHMLVLHRDQKDDVIKSVKNILNKYDPTSLMVFANADDDFRHVLNHEIQMIAFVEKHVCEQIVENTKFKFTAA